jgi:hypothetical protein
MLDVFYVDAYAGCWMIHKYTKMKMLIYLCIMYNVYLFMWAKLHVGLTQSTETQQYPWMLDFVLKLEIFYSRINLIINKDVDAPPIYVILDNVHAVLHRDCDWQMYGLSALV